MRRQTFDKAIQRVTVLELDGAGRTTTTLIYRKKRKKKRNSRRLRDLEDFTKDAFKAKQNQVDTYLDRHRKSNRKKKNGWLKDLPTNLVKAQRKGLRKLRKSL